MLVFRMCFLPTSPGASSFFLKSVVVKLVLSCHCVRKKEGTAVENEDGCEGGGGVGMSRMAKEQRISYENRLVQGSNMRRPAD